MAWTTLMPAGTFVAGAIIVVWLIRDEAAPSMRLVVAVATLVATCGGAITLVMEESARFEERLVSNTDWGTHTSYVAGYGQVAAAEYVSMQDDHRVLVRAVDSHPVGSKITFFCPEKNMRKYVFSEFCRTQMPQLRERHARYPFTWREVAYAAAANGIAYLAILLVGVSAFSRAEE